MFSPNTVIGFESFINFVRILLTHIRHEQFIIFIIIFIVVGKQIMTKHLAAFTRTSFSSVYKEKSRRFPIEVYVRMQ